MTSIAAYRPVLLAAAVIGALVAFLAFFFVFLLAPVVPLAFFYLGYLVVRERRIRSERREERALLERESDARDEVLRRRASPEES